MIIMILVLIKKKNCQRNQMWLTTERHSAVCYNQQQMERGAENSERA